jgi:septum formation topological specificity factor MinE
MRSPIQELRKEILKDIEKYSVTDNQKILEVLKEYVELIDEIYVDDEKHLMVNCFVRGFRQKKELNKKFQDGKIWF